MTIQANELHACQVLQRGSDGKASVALASGEILELPAGGPYEVGGASSILVGDLWILAGQSNMEGVGDLVDVEPPSPFVHSFQSCEKWAVAEESLHWLGESPQLVHHKLWGRDAVPDVPDPRDIGRTKGAGLGLSFAKARYAQTGVPIGLVPSAHGGTSMQQWNPALKSEGGGSLYGATLKRFASVGGKVAGILWYQGESDSNPVDMANYKARMTKLVESFRSDFQQPDLPFYIVQIGCFATPDNPDLVVGWNGIREAERTWPDEVPHSAVASAIDLALDDGIHIGTPGLKRLGKRLANIAAGFPAPALGDLRLEGNRLRIAFENVRGGLQACGRPTGFSLRHPDGGDTAAIYKTTIEDNCAILHLNDASNLPAGVTVWYGYGLNPYCNITDAEDAALPAFGPVTIPTV